MADKEEIDKDIRDIAGEVPATPVKEEPTETPWTSIDLYYKGFHIKKSLPHSLSPESLKESIDKYSAAGFEPSWNKATSEEHLNGHSKPATTPVAPVVAVPLCPKCQSEMWDNRPKKATGEFKPKSPDFKCKNENCSFVIWPEKK